MAVFLIALLCLLSSCAGSPGTEQEGPPPTWVSDMETAYPLALFIAVTGRGADRKAAETNALAGIARYFQSEVQSRTASVVSRTSGNGAASLTRSLSEETFVNSEVSLFAVRYTNAWRDPATKEWVCAAYIDREEAWAIYEPRLCSLAGSFTAAFDAAESEDDTIRMVLRYSAALQAASDNDLFAALDFAQTLAPRKAGAFDQVRRNLAETPQKIADAKALSPLTVWCDNDVDGIITVAITGVFASGGFQIADNNQGTHRIEAKIDEGRQDLAAGTFFTPRLTVTVAGGGGVAFTWTASVSRLGAKDPDLAQRRAWTALAAEVERGLWAAFEGR